MTIRTLGWRAVRRLSRRGRRRLLRRAVQASTATALAGALAAACQSTPAASVLDRHPAVSATTAGAAPTAGLPARGAGAAGSALRLLPTVPVRPAAPLAGYSRAQFGPAWADVDRNGCDTRNDVLTRDLTARAYRAGTHGCVVVAGTLADPYTGRTLTFAKAHAATVQIDHVVALGHARQTGAAQLSAAQREQLANDPLELLAVDGPANEAKGDRDASQWLPPNRGFRCAYAARQIAVQAAYRLWVTPAEQHTLAAVLQGCPAQPLPDPRTAGSGTGSGTGSATAEQAQAATGRRGPLAPVAAPPAAAAVLPQPRQAWRPRRVHGTPAGWRVGCRQSCCVQAWRRAHRNQAKRRAARGPALLDASPVRAHLRVLLAAGLSPSAITRCAAGEAHRRGLPPLSPTTVRALLSGRTRRVHRGTAAVLLAVQPTVTARTLLAGSAASTASSCGGVLLDATGTRRRVQALAAGGWTFPALAGRLAPHGVLAQACDVRRLAVAGRAHVRWQTAAAVAAVYAELADLPGPDPGAAARARARGWLVPWWWNEDTIDRPEHDPVAAAANAAMQDCQPCTDTQREQIRRLSARINERTGRSNSAREIAARVGVSARTVVRHRALARTISASHARTPQPDPSTRGRSCSTLTCARAARAAVPKPCPADLGSRGRCAPGWSMEMGGGATRSSSGCPAAGSTTRARRSCPAFTASRHGQSPGHRRPVGPPAAA